MSSYANFSFQHTTWNIFTVQTLLQSSSAGRSQTNKHDNLKLWFTSLLSLSSCESHLEFKCSTISNKLFLSRVSHRIKVPIYSEYYAWKRTRLTPRCRRQNCPLENNCTRQEKGQRCSKAEVLRAAGLLQSHTHAHRTVTGCFLCFYTCREHRVS